MSYGALLGLDLMLMEMDHQYLNSMTPEAREAELHRRKLKRLSKKDERMQRRLARHRAAIWKRRWGHAGGWFLFMCALPLAIFIVSELWKLAAHSVFS